MTDDRLPRRILSERDNRVCPGSVHVPTRDGTCICGLPLGAHVWTHSGVSAGVRRVTEAEQAAYLNPPSHDH